MRLPQHVHEANVAGLHATTIAKARKPKACDNQPTFEELVAKIDALPTFDQRYALFEAATLTWTEAERDRLIAAVAR